MNFVRLSCVCLITMGACHHPPSDPRDSLAAVLPPRANYVPTDGTVLLIVGQDLSAVRAYRSSECCPPPAGATTYLGLYNVRSRPAMFGGLGFNADGRPILHEVNWGGGPISLSKTAVENAPGVIAIGLNMADYENKGALQQIAQGAFDPEIEHLARTLGQLPHPVLLRIGYEFDGAWNPGYENASAFINAYQHVARGVVRAGASNVAFVWQASSSLVDDVIEQKHESIEAWYPGDEFVDWVGMSWFLAPSVSAQVGPDTVEQRSLYDEIIRFAHAHRKPVFIAEASPQGFHLSEGYRANISHLIDGPSGTGRAPITGNEIWTKWYAPFFDFVRNHRDVIRAVAYINTDWNTQDLWDPPYENGFWGDSRVQSNAEVLSRWQRALEDPMWRHGGPELYPSIGASQFTTQGAP